MNPLAFDAPEFVAPDTLPAGLVAPSGIAQFYVSSHGYTTAPGDTPANTHFEGRLSAGFWFERSIIGTAGMGGKVALGFGELVLRNPDRYYDSLIADYAMDGRRVLVKRSSPPSYMATEDGGVFLLEDGGRMLTEASGTYADFLTVFDGTADGWRRGADEIRLRLRDMSWRLEVPIQSNVYAGTGGMEGPPALAGTPKPLAFGYCFNVTPVLVDPATRTYQCHDGPVQDIPAVREGGVLLTRVSSAPGIGQYSVDLSTASFQLGFDPLRIVTNDVKGDATGGLYVYTPATIAKRILLSRVGLAVAEIDAASFDRLDYLAPWESNLYVGSQPMLAAAAIDQLMAAVGGFAGPSRAGTYQVGVLTRPDTTAPLFTLREEDIIDIEEIAPPDFLYPPPKRMRVGYRKNWTPTTNLAPSLVPDVATALMLTYLSAAAFSSPIAASFLSAQESALLESPLVSGADGATLAAQLLTLYTVSVNDGGLPRLFKIVTDRYLDQVELGMTGQFAHSLFGLSAGRFGVIVAWHEDAGARQLTLTMFG